MRFLKPNTFRSPPDRFEYPFTCLNQGAKTQNGCATSIQAPDIRHSKNDKNNKKLIQINPKDPKMKPNGSQNLPRRRPEASCDPGRRQEPPEIDFSGLRGRPGGPKQIIGWAPALPRGEKLIDFTLPGGPQEGPGEAPGGQFASIFVTRPAGTKKVRKTQFFLIV